MKKLRTKVSYHKPSKRNVMKDVASDAGRRAKNRAAEKRAENRLRNALGNPSNTKGKPVAGHQLKLIAASRLTTQVASNPDARFDFASNAFASTLKYEWGRATYVSDLWKQFLNLVANVDPQLAGEFAGHYAGAFRWSLAGHVHRLALAYQQRPDAVEKVEILQQKKSCVCIGVQRDGARRTIAFDSAPEYPMIAFAGMKVRHFIAPKDLKVMEEIGSQKFLAEVASGLINTAPPPEALVDQDALLNIAPPTHDDLATIRRGISLLGFKPGFRVRAKA